jgi:hypothetical protein
MRKLPEYPILSLEAMPLSYLLCVSNYKLWELTITSTVFENNSMQQRPPDVRPLDSFREFYGTRRFNNDFTRAFHLFLSWCSSIQYTSPHSTSPRSILILSTHLRFGLPRGFWKYINWLNAKKFEHVISKALHNCGHFFSLWFWRPIRTTDVLNLTITSAAASTIYGDSSAPENTHYNIFTFQLTTPFLLWIIRSESKLQLQQ